MTDEERKWLADHPEVDRGLVWAFKGAPDSQSAIAALRVLALKQVRDDEKDVYDLSLERQLND